MITADPLAVGSYDCALPTNGHRPAAEHADHLTGPHAGFLLGEDEDDDIDASTLGPNIVKSLRKWWRKYGLDQPQTWADAPVLPVALIAEALDDVPTRREAAEDAVERGDDDPHEVADRLKSERTKRLRERKHERAENQVSAKSMADRVLTVSGLAQLPPPTALVDGFLYRGTLAQLAGHPGDGKTFAALGMSCAVATGRRWNGADVPEALPVVYVAAEGSTGLFGRVAAWCGANEVDMSSLEDRLHVLPEPVQLGDAEQVRQLGSIVHRTGAGLVVLDTRARCTLGLEENSATEQGLAVAAAERLIAGTGATVLVVHHLGAASQRGRGSTAWDGAVYSNLILGRTAGGDVEVRCDKHKDARDGCKHQFRLQPHTVGLDVMPDADERRRSSLVLVAADPMTEDLSERNAAVLAVIAATAGPDGLTGTQIAAFADERGVCKRTVTYEAVKALVGTAQIVNGRADDMRKPLVNASSVFRPGVRLTVPDCPDDLAVQHVSTSNNDGIGLEATFAVERCTASAASPQFTALQVVREVPRTTETDVRASGCRPAREHRL